jgi:alkanesulfonate monooxygenase SsuD/methylene tetrahydromethanopterin reductase-like flavin-dependent oxidoreductase (luciferase family)
VPVQTDTRPLKLGTADVPTVPIDVAALARGALQLVAEAADGWLPFMLPVSQLGSQLELIRKARSDQADAPTRLVTAPTIPALVSSDGVQAREVTGATIVLYTLAMGEFYPAYLSSLGFADEVAALREANDRPNDGIVPPGTESLIDDQTIHGDPATIRASLERWYEAGADEVLLFLPPGAPADLMRETIETLAPTRS